MKRRKNISTGFVVFHGELKGGELCGLVNGARMANALDLLRRASKSGYFSRVMLFTDSVELIGKAAGTADAVVLTNASGFHFGEMLFKAVRESGCDRMCYFGSGAGSLLTDAEFSEIAQSAYADEVVANNLYSTDFCSFPCVRIGKKLKLPVSDNAMSRFLIEKHGLKGRELPRGTSTIFDIDAPLDLVALKLSGKSSGLLKKFIDENAPDAPHVVKAIRQFTRNKSEVLVSGRISADTHMFLDRNTACRIRLISEERGLVSSGDVSSARSIIGLWMKTVGMKKVLEILGGRIDAAFMDSRILLAGEGTKTTAEERFEADLLRTNHVSSGYLKSLIEAVEGSKYPVVLANHSLMNGGMMLLVDASWKNSRAELFRDGGLRGKNR